MYSAYKLNKQGENTQPLRTPFAIWNQSVVPCLVLTFASWPVYRFHRRQVRWSGISISLRIFQFVVIYPVKGFSIVNKVEVDVFLEFFNVFYDPTMLAIWSLVPLLFLNPACSSESSRFTYCWSLSWRILRISLLACEMSSIVWYFEHSLASVFFWDSNENWSFPVLWLLLSFPNLLAYWVQHFNSIIF